jgi:hypothetical protein
MVQASFAVAFLFDPGQFLALFVAQERFQRLISLAHDLADLRSGLGPDLLQLVHGAIKDRGDLCHLFRREIELGFDPVAHPLGRGMGMAPEAAVPLPAFMKSKEGAGDCPGQKGEDESRHPFPFPGGIPGSKTLLMAESAMAYSSPPNESLPMSGSESS